MGTTDKDEEMEETKRIMERLVKMPPQPHRSEGAAPKTAPRPEKLRQGRKQDRQKAKD